MNVFDYDNLIKQQKELECKMQQESFWDDQKLALSITNEYNSIKENTDKYSEISNLVAELTQLIEGLDSLEEEYVFARELLNDLTKKVSNLQNELLFSDPLDKLNAIVEVHCGAGGVEAQDWADMLYRMYVRWAEKHHYKMKVMSFQNGEEAGIKSVTLKISGKNIYGLLKGEKGVHRLVRISPFDSNSRRHTSFASVKIIPEFKENIDIEILDKDLRIDTFRAGGAGGQNVNKVSSAVRITHLPSKIVVSSQIERSQLLNKETCMEMLKAQLYERALEEKKKKLNNIVGEEKDIEWGSQIKSYVFCPYTMVKDHRTGYSVNNVAAVMDGDIDDFLYAYLGGNR